MRITDFLYDLWSKGLDLIYPASSGCPLCGVDGRCSCRERLLKNYLDSYTCPRCGKFLSPGAATCRDCQSRGLGFPDRVYALAPYSGGMRRAIHRFKYQSDRRTGDYLAELLFQGLGLQLPPVDLIIPVPLHREKQHRRGFNQAEVLGNYLGRKLSTEVKSQALIRALPTQPQAELTKDERRKNLVNAFQSPCPETINGKNVLLVDDIITTGFTFEGCGVALRAAGAEAIIGICLASGSQNK